MKRGSARLQAFNLRHVSFVTADMGKHGVHFGASALSATRFTFIRMACGSPRG